MKTALEGQTGVLLILDGTNDLALYFERGNVTATAQRESDSKSWLGQLLMRTGAIDDHQLVDALEVSRHLECPLGDALMSRGHVDRGQLLRTLAGQVRQRLVEAAQSTPYQVVFHEGVPCPLKAVPVGINVPITLLRARTLALSARKIADIVRAEAVFGDQWLKRATAASVVDGNLGRLTEPQRALWEAAFGAVMPLGEIQLTSTMGRHETHGFVFALIELGFLEACAPPVYDERVEKLERELDAREAHNERSKSAFDILGIHWSAVPIEIEAAVEKLRRTLAVPSAMALPGAVASKLERIKRALDEAAKQLSNEPSRQALRAQFTEPAQLTFAAQHAMNQGKTARFRGDLRTAMIEFTRAAELDPELPGALAEVKRLTKPHGRRGRG